MGRAPSAMLAVGVAVLAGACGAAASSGASSNGPGSTTAAAILAPATSTTPVTYRASPGAAERQACHQDVATTQQASDGYALEHGHPAASLAALVAAGMLRSVPATGHGYVVDYNPVTGKVTARGICTG